VLAVSILDVRLFGNEDFIVEYDAMFTVSL